MLYLGSHLLSAAGLVTRARQQEGRLHRAGLLDGGIVTLGFGILSWASIISPCPRSELCIGWLVVLLAADGLY